jgi:hypothetical protein
MRPFKKVPVVRIILEDLTSLPERVSNPLISFLLKINLFTGSEKNA